VASWIHYYWTEALNFTYFITKTLAPEIEACALQHSKPGQVKPALSADFNDSKLESAMLKRQM